MPPPDSSVDPYDALAAGYDVVMAHVDYSGWADYVLDLFEEHGAAPRSVLELGCGTGSLALEVVERLGDDLRYLATDRSPSMIRVARAKAKQLGWSALTLRFDVADFTDFTFRESFDAVLLLYDGVNYLLDEADVAALLTRVHAALAPGGLFIMDQSTPANSLNNADYFGDEGEVDRFAYVRRSRYDEASRIHTTEFDLTIDGKAYGERHLQRAYALEEMAALIAASPLERVAAYDGFSLDEAHANSERIHWVLRRPPSSSR